MQIEGPIRFLTRGPDDADVDRIILQVQNRRFSAPITDGTDQLHYDDYVVAELTEDASGHFHATSVERLPYDVMVSNGVMLGDGKEDTRATAELLCAAWFRVLLHPLFASVDRHLRWAHQRGIETVAIQGSPTTVRLFHRSGEQKFDDPDALVTALSDLVHPAGPGCLANGTVVSMDEHEYDAKISQHGWRYRKPT